MKGFFKRPLIAVKVIIQNENDQILVMRRSITAPRRPLQWDLPGGIVDPGESPKEAGIRETHEEVGLSIKDVQLVEVSAETDPHHVVVVFYGARIASQQVKLSYEHDQFEWVSKADFMELKINQSFKEAVKIFDKS